jgi:hypothetical protein
MYPGPADLTAVSLGASTWSRPRRPLAWAALVAGVLALLVLLPPLLFVGVRCAGGGPAAVPPPEVARRAAGIVGYGRPESATFLTLPRWAIVYSADEYATFIGAQPPSGFPYLGAIRQYWTYYGRMCGVTKGRYPFAFGEHLRLALVGAGFSVEQAVKGLYEGTLGRVVEWISSRDTQEDAFAARTARAYAASLRTAPGYEFPFFRTLAALWRETSLWGPSPLRKWERKVVLSAEYGVKGTYGWLGWLSTRLIAADPTTHASIDAAPVAFYEDTRVRVVASPGRRVHVIALPRYVAFTEMVSALERRNVVFLDIAGNDEILVTAIVPRGVRYAPRDGTLVLEAPLLTDPGQRRVGVRAAVRDLHLVVDDLEGRGVRLEHVYDY